MTKIYNTNNKLMFLDDNLSLKELVENNKKNLMGANLSGADLSGADLSGADLSGADLRFANLREADLRDSDLTGASLRNSDLREAYFHQNTILPCGKTIKELLNKGE